MLGAFFLINYFRFISCFFFFFFRGFLFFELKKEDSFVFSFCLTFSISMSSGKNSYLVLPWKSLSCQNESNSLQNQWFWWKYWIWSGHELHLPTGYAGSYHFGRTWPEDWGARSRTRVSPLLSGQQHPVGGKSRLQAVEAEVIKVELSWLCSRVGFVPEYMLFPSPSMGPFPPEISDAVTRGARAGVQCGSGQELWWSWPQSQF